MEEIQHHAAPKNNGVGDGKAPPSFSWKPGNHSLIVTSYSNTHKQGTKRNSYTAEISLMPYVKTRHTHDTFCAFLCSFTLCCCNVLHLSVHPRTHLCRPSVHTHKYKHDHLCTFSAQFHSVGTTATYYCTFSAPSGTPSSTVRVHTHSHTPTLPLSVPFLRTSSRCTLAATSSYCCTFSASSDIFADCPYSFRLL